jgi:uncharacterized protein YecT (DUF1311 family)
MSKWIHLFFLVCPAFLQANEIDCETPISTYALNVCIASEVEATNAELDKYLGMALEKSSEEIAVVDLLVKSQESWLAFRRDYCDATYETWSGGTIRGVMFGKCMLKLTKQRTHQIWEDYLTYMDSTPPLLPEPK